MRIWDEALLLRRGKDPVMDGLLFWLDGRDGTLTDRVQGDTLKVSVPSGGVNYRWDADFLQLYGTIQYARWLYLHSTIGYTGIRCVEALLGLGADTGQGTGFCDPGSSSGIRFWYRTQAIQAVSKNSWWWGTQDSSVRHLLIQRNANGKPEFYVNGELRYTGTESIGSFTASTVLAYYSDGSTHSPAFRIGSLRLYNRVLDAEEIQRNVQYEIDTGRLTV